ncbi:hypothetical protein B0H14DRAFT_1415862 [Mycena olivaceomarginata]|nr:hypothetical protein B0H14DRAFT_1415862 [Mycena olivaceomarginata]
MIHNIEREERSEARSRRVGRRKEERGKEGVTKSRREAKGRKGKERNKAPATAVSVSPPHQPRQIHLRPRRNNLPSSVVPRCQTSALDKHNILNQYPAGRRPHLSGRRPPISATTSSSRSVTTDCSVRADDVPQPGRRHRIFKYMREKKKKQGPSRTRTTHERERISVHRKRKIAERTSRPSTKYALQNHLAQRGSRQTHTAPLGRYVRKKSGSRICARKYDTCARDKHHRVLKQDVCAKHISPPPESKPKP